MKFDDFFFKLYLGVVVCFGCLLPICFLGYQVYLECFHHEVPLKHKMQNIAVMVKEQCLDTNMKICEFCLQPGGFGRCDNKTILKTQKEMEDFVKRYGE